MELSPASYETTEEHINVNPLNFIGEKTLCKAIKIAKGLESLSDSDNLSFQRLQRKPLRSLRSQLDWNKENKIKSGEGRTKTLMSYETAFFSCLAYLRQKFFPPFERISSSRKILLFIQRIFCLITKLFFPISLFANAFVLPSRASVEHHFCFSDSLWAGRESH